MMVQSGLSLVVQRCGTQFYSLRELVGPLVGLF